MNSFLLLPMTSTPLAFIFFAIAAAARADYPALMVYCEFGLLPLKPPRDSAIRKTPLFYDMARDHHICYACPPTTEYEHRVNDRSESRRILFIHDTGVFSLHLDQPMPKCKSKVRPTIRKKSFQKYGDRVEYEVGFQALRVFQSRTGVKVEDLIEDLDLPFKHSLTIYFDQDSGQTISAVNYITRRSFLPTASIAKTNIEYEKNEDILGIGLDHLYLHFRATILPRMEAKCSTNPFAHELGIEKIQLVPKDDYALDTWKIVTYLDINTAPVWSILLLKWNAVEIFVRKIGKMMVFISVETGITGTSELVEKYYQQNDPPTESELKLRVPEYVWKVVTFDDGENEAAILVIMHNDPFTEGQQPLCDDICAANGWLVSNKDHRTGIIYCCKVTKEIASFLKSSARRAYDVLNLSSFGFRGKHKLSEFLSGEHKEVYDW